MALTAWAGGTFIQQQVNRIIANENKVLLEDGSQLEYDILSINVGSKTKGYKVIPGVQEFAIPTRPVNLMLSSIKRKEKEFYDNGITPVVVVCGGGLSGIELAFALKQRWSEYFNIEISVSLVDSHDKILPFEERELRESITSQLKSFNISIIVNANVSQIK